MMTDPIEQAQEERPLLQAWPAPSAARPTVFIGNRVRRGAAPGKKFPAVYFAGTVSGVTGIYRSDNEGKSFVRINDDSHQYGGCTVLTGDPRVYGRVYMASGGRGILYGEPRGK